MSFLATEDDKSILSEAFAFIETFSGENSSVDATNERDLDDVPLIQDLIDDGSLGLLDVPTRREQASHQISPTKRQKGDDAPEQNPTKKRRVRNAETSSTAIQRRKRAELANLRGQVEELQDVLTQLKQAGVAPLPRGAQLETHGKWHRDAIKQCHLRLQAEKMNRQLKVILKNHNKVREMLSGVLQKRSVLYGMDYVTDLEVPSYGGVLSRNSHVDAWMHNLEDTSERLYLHANSIFEAMQQTTSVNSSMQCKYDERRRTKMIVFETTTPLNCSLEDASDFLWRDFQSDRTLGAQPNTLEKNMVLRMPSRQGAIEAEKLHFMRKYQAEDQTLVSWADIMVPPTKREFHFRAEGLVLLARSQMNPDQAVSRSFLNLYLDSSTGNSSLRPEDVAYAQDIVMGAMATKLRLYWQSFQNMMLEGADLVSNQNIAAYK